MLSGDGLHITAISHRIIKQKHMESSRALPVTFSTNPVSQDRSERAGRSAGVQGLKFQTAGVDSGIIIARPSEMWPLGAR